MAKNRVAPVKTISLPRLESMGAVTGARLANHLRGIVKPQNIFMWSDSHIVLSWIMSTKKLKPFIANRLSEIRELVGNCEWNYCQTDINPADYLTRGISAKQLQKSSIWKNGPNWILNRVNWPNWNKTLKDCNALTTVSEDTVNNRLPDISEKAHLTHSFIDTSRYSSLQKLIRITVYILRFISNIRESKDKRRYEPLCLSERNIAFRMIVKLVQKETFQDEITSIKSTIKGTSLIRQLKLYLDENGILHCAGRIHNAPVKEDTKHPILLPTHHSLTALVVNDAHESTHHGGPNITIANIQQKYWIPKIRQTVRSQLRKCVTCRKTSGKQYSAPDPPPLPKHRVNYEFPFSVTVIDFTGALDTKGPNNEYTKSYICLFTCAATRAVHLEIVPDLSEESFILTFRRFCARRSVPRIMISDNGSNFKAAAERITRSNKNSRIQETLNEKGTEWKFIPNRAPWFGGYCERLIGIIKRAIKCTLGKACVSTEMLRTIVTEIEATMNNRPITYISTDITDPEPLTPSHMLHGRRTDCEPDEITLENSVITENLHVKLNRNYQRQNELLQQFRNRRTQEYLTSLREFHRMTGKMNNR